jgi:DNA-binding response OmpR family regulator
LSSLPAEGCLEMATEVARKPVFKARCLVVDDDEDLRWVVMRSLMRAEFHCEAARDGDHALQLMSQGDFQIIVTDLRMPKKHGFNLATEIMKATQAKPAIIVYTGIEEPKLVAQLLAMGVDDVLIKPMNPDIIAAKVTAVYGRWVERQSKEEAASDSEQKSEVKTRKSGKSDRKVVKLVSS